MICDAALVHHDRRRLALRALRDHLTVIDHHPADREAGRECPSDRPAAASSRAPVGPLFVRLHGPAWPRWFLAAGRQKLMVKQKPPHRIGGIVDRAAKTEPDISPRELVENVPGIRQRPGQPVQLGHHQRVASPTGSKRQPQTGSVPVGAGQAVIDIDAIITDTKRMQTVALGGEILLLC